MIKNIIKTTIIVNNAILAKKKICFVNNDKITLNFLKKILELNLIKNFSLQKNNKIQISLNFNKNKTLVKGLKNYYKPSNIIIVNNNNIKKIFLKKNKTLYLFLTNQNILNSYELLKKNIGGILLCRITL